MSDYRVVVYTSDRYQLSIRKFARLFNELWSKDQQVLVAGFTKPDFVLPSNFEFHSIGKPEDYPVQKWSNSLIDLFKQIDDEVFVFMGEDYLIADKVDIEGVQTLVDYANANSSVIRIDLTLDRWGQLTRDGYPYTLFQVGNLNMFIATSQAPYSLSVTTSIWRKENILKFLEPDWDPWEVETKGSNLVNVNSSGMNLFVYGTEKLIVPTNNGIHHTIVDECLNQLLSEYEKEGDWKTHE